MSLIVKAGNLAPDVSSGSRVKRSNFGGRLQSGQLHMLKENCVRFGETGLMSYGFAPVNLESVPSPDCGSLLL